MRNQNTLIFFFVNLLLLSCNSQEKAGSSGSENTNSKNVAAGSGFGLTDVFATDIDQTMTVFNFQRERFYPEAYVRAEAKEKEALGGDPGRSWPSTVDAERFARPLPLKRPREPEAVIPRATRVYPVIEGKDGSISLGSQTMAFSDVVDETGAKMRAHKDGVINIVTEDYVSMISKAYAASAKGGKSFEFFVVSQNADGDGISQLGRKVLDLAVAQAEARDPKLPKDLRPGFQVKWRGLPGGPPETISREADEVKGYNKGEAIAAVLRGVKGGVDSVEFADDSPHELDSVEKTLAGNPLARQFRTTRVNLSDPAATFAELGTKIAGRDQVAEPSSVASRARKMQQSPKIIDEQEPELAEPEAAVPPTSPRPVSPRRPSSK